MVIYTAEALRAPSANSQKLADLAKAQVVRIIASLSLYQMI